MIVTVWTCGAGHEVAVTDHEVDLLRAAYDEDAVCRCGSTLGRRVRDGSVEGAAVAEAHVRLRAVRARYGRDHPKDEKEEP